MNLGYSTKRKVFARASIAVGNTVQTGGIVAAYSALMVSRSAHPPALAIATMMLAWVLLYFCSHAIAHWLVGRLVGIRFLFYTVGGTGNPEGWPWGLRWVFEHLPFFDVQTDKVSNSSLPLPLTITTSGYSGLCSAFTRYSVYKCFASG
jgi:hypothetical protein